MSLFRILFLGTPEISLSSLEALHEDPHFEVVGVVTQPDRPKGRNMKVQPCAVKARALELGLNCFSPESVNNEDVLKQIQDLRPDSAVVIAFGQILSSQFLSLFPIPSVNLHASLLPRWRGAAPIQRAIQSGDSTTGMCLQVIVPQLDAGPLIGQREIPIGPDTNSMQLAQQLSALCPEILKQDFLDYLRTYLSPKEQSSEGVTIAKKIKKTEGQIRWQDSADQIYRNYLAFAGWPGTWSFWNQKKIKVFGMKKDSGQKWTAAPGTIVDITDQGLIVQTGIGVVCLSELQPESKSKMKALEFVAGYRIEKGQVFQES